MRISDTTPLQNGVLMYNCTLNTKHNIQVSDNPPKPFHYYFAGFQYPATKQENPASATKEEMQAERLAFFVYIPPPDLLPD